jgi:hypothetical protein
VQTLDLIDGHRQLLDQISTAAINDSYAIWQNIGDIADPGAKAVLAQALEEAIGPYWEASSMVGAEWYEQSRRLSLDDSAPVLYADTAEAPDSSRWWSLAGAAINTELDEKTAGTGLSLLAGGVQKTTYNGSRETVATNAFRDTTVTGYQRVPQSGCCAFCAMLASRGAVYSSESAAGTVVGRGVPVEQTKGKRGGQGKGVRPRGTRDLGEDFHDYCRCVGKAVHRGDTQELVPEASKWMDTYRDAYSKVNAGLVLKTTTHKAPDGSLKNTYRWEKTDDGSTVSPKRRTSMILTHMRQELEVH